MWYILDKSKNPIHVEKLEGAKWSEDCPKDKIVKQTSIKNYWVSTVFLGLDHSNYGGPPIVFETRITKDREWLAYQDRYCTWKAASQGHRDAMRKVIKLIRENKQ